MELIEYIIKLNNYTAKLAEKNNFKIIELNEFKTFNKNFKVCKMTLKIKKDFSSKNELNINFYDGFYTIIKTNNFTFELKSSEEFNEKMDSILESINNFINKPY